RILFHCFASETPLPFHQQSQLSFNFKSNLYFVWFRHKIVQPPFAWNVALTAFLADPWGSNYNIHIPFSSFDSDYPSSFIQYFLVKVIWFHRLLPGHLLQSRMGRLDEVWNPFKRRCSLFPRSR